MFRPDRRPIVLATLAAFSTISWGLGGAIGEELGHFGTKQPYAPPTNTSYSAPPSGYDLVSVQHVARHGSRLLSSAKYDDLSLQLWELAEAENGLTPKGVEFGDILREIMAFHESHGYGNLSDLGRQEHFDMAGRVFERDRALFDAALVKGEQFEVLSSGKDRAVDSGLNFVEGVLAANPELKSSFQDMAFDTDMLYFHKSDEAYLAYEDGDPRLEAAVEQLTELPAVADASRKVLSIIYTDAFLERLAGGEISLVDRNKGSSKIDDIASAADSLYNLYIILPGIPELDVDLSQFVPEEQADVLSYFSDGEQFYEKGPGFAGETVTYRMAGALLEDFFDSIDQRLQGGNLAGNFRFTHAEEIIPFAALLKVSGSDVQAKPDELFSYENNPWRGAIVSPMGANIQWDVFANPNGNAVVRMLYNERETKFYGNCVAVEGSEYFYDLEELRKCLLDDKS
jgi:hypothetical protein